MKIKVCGMRNSKNIMELIKLAPDYIGFIFYEKSPRFAGNILTREITSQIPETIKKTGVLVNTPEENLIKTSNTLGLTTVQLHGNESPRLCRTIRNEGFEVIKAFSLKNRDDVVRTKEYIDSCDFFLFDTPSAGYGGSGQKFDWSLLSDITIEQPFFLSGGIEEKDASALLTQSPVQPYAIDINSRFETTPGLKNINSVRRFIQSIRKEQR